MTKRDQELCADLLLICTSEPQGICYLETANLDGETNLKLYQAHASTETLNEDEDFSRLRGFIDCDQPNKFLYTFTGVLARKREVKQPLGFRNCVCACHYF